jgi:hypothetical protein
MAGASDKLNKIEIMGIPSLAFLGCIFFVLLNIDNKAILR